MPDLEKGAPGPLGNQSKEEIEFLLRGFPEAAITSALALRTRWDTSELETCLLGILMFYLPAGAQISTSSSAGDIRIREDLGLDSLSVAESMFKIEELFDLHVETAEIAEIDTIGDASRLLTVKLTASTTGCSDA